MGENQLIVLTGGPGTGKSQLLATLQKKGFHCYEEISRQVIDKGKRQGMSNYFLSSPLAFSKELFEGRKTQHQSAKALPYDTEKPYVFLDRGLPDVVAYLKALGENTEAWETEMIKFPYDKVVFYHLGKPFIKRTHKGWRPSKGHKNFQINCGSYINHIIQI